MTDGLSTLPAEFSFRLFNFGIFEQVACVASGIVIEREKVLVAELRSRAENGEETGLRRQNSHTRKTNPAS